MTNNNILFYSNKCNYCTQIIHLINKIDDINSYKLICIDDNINKFPYIQRVPTLLISEYKKPIVGINAFNWINSRNQFNKKTNNINLNPNSNINPKFNTLLNSNQDEKLNDKININDYSFIDEKNESKIENFYNQKIYTLPEVEKINQNNQKKKIK